MRGHFTAADSTLVIDNQEVSVSSDGSFNQNVPVQDVKKQTIRVTIIAARGIVQTAELTLNFPRNLAFKDLLFELSSDRRDFVRLAAGLNFISYRETGVVPIYEDNLSLQAFYTRVLTRSFSFNISSYYSHPVHERLLGNELSFLGLDGRVGFSPHWPDEPWKLTLFGGAYYVRTFSQIFGYELVGPQIYPYLERRFLSGDSVNAYFKFSPLRASNESLTLSNREVSGGLGYVHRLASKHPLSYNLDVSKLDFQTPQQSIDQLTLSASVGYGF